MPTTLSSRTSASAAADSPSTSLVEGASPRARRIGKALMWFLALFLLFDGGARAVGFAPYVEGTVQSGYPEGYGVGIGLTLVAATLLYLIPPTAVLGAVLLTAYLGAAVSINLRLGVSFLFPLIFGVLVWGALYLLEPRVRELIPLRR